MKATHLLLAFAASAAFLAPTHAERYPSKPVTLVSPLPAGASTDVVTRAWMHCAQRDSLAGQPFVLVNKPGANGVVAASFMKQQPADGYTVMVAGMSQTTITPYVFKKPPYDPEKDFEGAAMFAVSPLTLVASAQSGIKTMDDLVAYAKARPGGIDFGIGAIGAPGHLLSAALAAKLGIKATMVPMNGEPNGLTALMGEQVPVMIFLTGSATQYIDNGKLVPILNFTDKRLPTMPAVPTAGEVLHDPGFARTAWIGITTKAGSPPEVTQSIDRWTQACLDTPEFNRALKQALFAPQYVSAKDYAGVVKRDIAFWRPWIERLGITND
ncbi:tripartite tricarboxylate transporter substrate binding protein [Variovorax sp. ZS18.2.2]|uniref:Bug family tripartite tricarboxylate transporter substrate binding protein n=1 Tax=Variovorax sp. ZS18.2.2 TaxID=2971255 RepID=UPI0021518156|nr:tripartite tricarboxylate transporter substrate binding protein [Variovorax sp. ZS18.2.2]MCR6475962.1 tripartite tricarboxylate transporter substrate binding protein [Variovorax sp. ZS18.2.2]